MELKGKKVIIIGERDGVQGPAIAACVESAGAEPLLVQTQCGAVDKCLDSQIGTKNGKRQENKPSDNFHHQRFRNVACKDRDHLDARDENPSVPSADQMYGHIPHRSYAVLPKWKSGGDLYPPDGFLLYTFYSADIHLKYVFLSLFY